MKISGSAFIVTGGASGLGGATTKLLHSAGANVLIADLAEPREPEMSALRDRIRYIKADVTSEAEIAAAVNAALEAFGSLQGLINCAGIAPGERVVGKSGPHRLDTFARCVNINLIGTFNCIRLAAAAMARQKPAEDGERGVIINTASIAAFEGQIGQAAYSASKAGIVGMTLPIARELATVGIRVVTIAPGLFLTPMMQTLPAEVQAALARSTPFPQRLGDPTEFAALAKHIVENLMINGETLRLDGAVRLAAR